jgi:hypothetical protein
VTDGTDVSTDDTDTVGDAIVTTVEVTVANVLATSETTDVGTAVADCELVATMRWTTELDGTEDSVAEYTTCTVVVGTRVATRVVTKSKSDTTGASDGDTDAAADSDAAGEAVAVADTERAVASADADRVVVAMIVSVGRGTSDRTSEGTVVVEMTTLALAVLVNCDVNEGTMEGDVVVL